MSISVEDFFKAQSFDEKPDQHEYKGVENLINFAQVLSEISYESVYIIDYVKQGFLYVSKNPIFLCGCTPEEVLKDGYNFYFKHVPKNDLALLLKINEVGFAFWQDLSPEDRLKYVISYDFHLMQPQGGLLLVNHKLIPVFLNKEGNAWIALCVVSISPNSTSGNIKFNSKELDRHFQYNLQTNTWTAVERVKLNSREKEILLLSAQGLTMDNIADKLCLSIDTIKFHKKNVFSKLRVKSISEAITASMIGWAI